MIADAIHRLVRGEDLEAAIMEASMDAILAGEASSAQIAALAVALRMKGETSTEIASAARSMRARCAHVELGVNGPVIDTCGTGGDGAGTFNVSTVSAIVVAACGVRVAKHGNRAVSSRAGSADVLEELGICLDVGPEGVARCVREVGIGFLFAPAHHAALRHAAPVRKELGIRTFFNLLGPLSNPASVSHQVVGVYDPARLRQMAEVLGMLGVEGALIVHGEGGLDEITPTGPTHYARFSSGKIEEGTLEPRDFGLEHARAAELEGGDAAQNARIARALLGGEKGAARTAVLMNAGAALELVGAVHDLREGALRAAEAIDDGSASRLLEAWAELTRGGSRDGQS